MQANQSREVGVLGGGLAWLMLPVSVALWAIAPEAIAQITPDDTLGAESSRVRRNVEVRGRRGDRIDGGAIRAGNLFHSFSEFNVNELQRVYFSNPAGIENILSRVTGNDVSNIFGTLGVDGNANLFLLNPNGIVFGPNSTLDVAGSFVATTADAFEFADGSSFSAVDPNAPPLLTVALTPGLQYGANAGAIQNQGNLSVGENLTLAAGNLNLQGQLQAGGDLTLHAQDTLTIRDSVTAPFIASSGQNLLMQGNQAVDIFALNHPESGLFAGNDLTLRSTTPVIGDAHYWSGGNFRIEQLDESLGALTSPNDPVIRAAGDVAFDSYTGASLHIFAGGSVTVPGAITIDGPDGDNGIVETVTLSNGSTVNINGRTTPTLDIRAGTLAVNPVEAIGNTGRFVPGVPALGARATSADITIGSIRNQIRNRGGTVFLTNQYQPNLDLAGGNIRVGAIDTSVVDEVNAVADPLVVRGGDVVIDARGGITAESVNTSADATVDITGVNAIGDVEVEATGGAIRLTAQNAIETGNLDSSASTDVSLSVTSNRGLEVNGLTPVTVGTIGNVTLTTTGGRIALESGTSITTTATIDSSVDGVLFADADVVANAFSVTGGTIGDVTLTTTGGSIALESGTSITTTDIIDSSVNMNADVGAITNDEITNDEITWGAIGDVTLTTTGGAIALESGTSITTTAIDSYANADTVAIAGSVTRGVTGNVTLTTTGGAIALESGEAITTGALNSSSDAFARAQAFANADGARFGADALPRANVGGIGNVTLTTRGGAIALESGTAITTGAINSSSESQSGTGNARPGVGNARPGVDTDSFAFSSNVSANASLGKIGDVTLTTQGGAIVIESGTTITTDAIDSSADGFVSVDAAARARAQARADINVVGIGDVILTTQGGAITLESGATITTRAIDSLADGVVGARTFAEANPNAVATVGGISSVTLTTQGGAIALESDATVTTGAIDSSADGFADARAFAFAFDGTTASAISERVGDVALTTRGGAIDLESNAAIITGAIDSSAVADATAVSDAFARAIENATADGRGIGNVTLTTQGGAINLESDAAITPGAIDSSATARVLMDVDVDAVAVTNPNAVAFAGEIGDIRLTTQGGAVGLSSTDSITASSVNSSSNSFPIADVKENGVDGTISSQIITGSGGAIDLAGVSGGVTLSEGSSIRSNVLGGDGDGGDIHISGAFVHLTNNLLTTTVNGAGDAGDITIGVTGDATISGSRILTGRESGAEGTGAGGRIDITASSIELTDIELTDELTNRSLLNTATFGAGDAGDVFLKTTEGDISLSDSGIFSFTAGQGSPGNIIINSAGALRLEGNSLISTSVALGVPGTSNSDSGDITINAADSVEIIGNGVVDPPTEPGTNPNLVSIGADTIATAQTINNSFALFNNPDVLFSNEVPYVAISASNNFVCSSACAEPGPQEITTNSNFYAVEVTAVGTQIIFDIDNTATAHPPGTLDVDLNLYDSDDNLIASNASAPISLGAGGSTTTNDAYLSYIFSEPGTYFIEASSLHTSTTEDSYDVQGSYTLNVSRVDDFLISSGISTQTRSGIPSGNITINSPTINIQNGGQISAETLRGGPAGDITLQPFRNGQDLTLTIEGEGSQISSSTQSTGAGGNLLFRAPNSITLQGNGQLLAETSGTGNAGDAGDVRIETADLTLRDEIEVSTTTEGTGRGGSILVNGINDTRADRVTLINAELSAETDGPAPAGDIQIRTGEFVMRNGAEVTTSTNNAGDGGDILIRAADFMRLGNSTIQAESNPIDEDGTVLTTDPGDAGRIQITTPQLLLQNDAKISASNVSSSSEGIQLLGLTQLTLEEGSQILASTDTGSAGDIEVDAPGGSVLLRGAGTRLAAETETETASSRSQAGTVSITTSQMSVLNNAEVSISTRNGRGGDLTLTVDDLTVSESRILAQTDNGMAGNLTVNGMAGNLRVNPPLNNQADSVLLSGVLADGTPAGLSVEATGEAGRAGNLSIYTRDLTVRDGADLSAETIEGNINNQGDTIRITDLENLTIENARISASTQRSGVAGGVTIRTSESVRLSGFWVDQDGNAIIDPNINLDDGRILPAGVFVEGRGDGIARPLRIFTGRLIVENGAQASVSTEDGKGGNLIIEATDSVRISEEAGLFARATGTGEAGRIDIQTPDLLLRDGATISATNVSTSSERVVLRGLNRLRVLDSEISTSTRRGVAGDVLVNRGADDSPVDSILVSGDTARIAAEATGEGGRAGSVQLNVRELTVQNGGTITAGNRSGTSEEVRIVNLDNLNVLSGGSISASTASGRAGNVIVSARDRVTVSGEGSRIEVEARRDGRAGNLEIRSGELWVTDGGVVSVSSREGQAGNLSVSSPIIFLDDGQLRAETAETERDFEGANINLQGLQLLVMQNGSLISASALNDANGGNITINSATTRGGFIAAPNFNNSDIIATAVQGRGGEINVFVDQLFGFTLQDSPEGLRDNLTNDISASSAGGPQGIVNLDTLDIDPSRGLGELPLALVSAPPLDAVCGAQRDEGQSSFVVAGREGLPSSPAEFGAAQPIPPAWVSRSGEAQPSAAEPSGTPEEPDTVVEIIEAQGWIIAADGTVSLIGADAPAEPSPPTPTSHPGCS